MNARPKRRRPRYSLRTMFAVLTALCAVASIFRLIPVSDWLWTYGSLSTASEMVYGLVFGPLAYMLALLSPILIGGFLQRFLEWRNQAKQRLGR